MRFSEGMKESWKLEASDDWEMLIKKLCGLVDVEE